ncbi:uncharacterized protein LOC144434821 [Glandiceps talaboti]
MPGCNDCEEVSSRVRICQGDLVLCPPCENRRFGNRSPPSLVSNSISSRNDNIGRANSEPQTQCGVIINELMCFITNKVHVLPNDIIVELCIKNFEDSEIEKAKKTLFDFVGEGKFGRYKKRQGQHKKSNNLNDILNMIHETDPGDMPCFVAQDLSKLPPVDITHVDISTMLKEIRCLRYELTTMKEETSKKINLDIHDDLNSLRSEVTELKEMFKHSGDNDNVNSINVTSSKSCQLRVVGTAVNENVTSPDNESTSGPTAEPLDDMGEVQPSHQHNKESFPQKCPSYVNVTASGSTIQPRAVARNDGSFTTVTRRRQRNRRLKPVIGSDPNKNDGMLQVVDSRPPARVFVSRLQPHTSSQTVVNFIRSKTNIESKCERLKSKYESYASFVIEVPHAQLPELMNASVWPEGALVRRYYQSKSN